MCDAWGLCDCRGIAAALLLLRLARLSFSLPTIKARAFNAWPFAFTSSTNLFSETTESGLVCRTMNPANGPAASTTLPRLDVPSTQGAQRYPTSVPSWARPKSPSASLRSRSSRSGSPATIGNHAHELLDENTEEDVLALSAGCQPDEVYKLSMPAWRYQIRKILVKGVEWESPILSKIQVGSLLCTARPGKLIYRASPMLDHAYVFR